MGRRAWTVGWCATALAAAGCVNQLAGLAVLPAGERPASSSLVDVDALMLDLPRMRGITGGGEDLNIIPSMDATTPVDVELLADEVPPPCRFLFAETATFGSDLADFHKTTYQEPPIGGLISQGAAAYRDAASARAALDGLAAVAGECAQTSFGQTYVGDVTSQGDSLRMRPGGDCGRDYRLKSVVLAEVTFCSFPESVPEIVMTNLVANVPG